MSWTEPGTLRKTLLKRWEKGTLISELARESLPFPYRIPLKGPSPREAGERYEELRLWIRRLEEEERRSSWVLEKREVNHRQLGRNKLPAALLFPSADALLCFLGKKREFEGFRRLAAETAAAFPPLGEWVLEKPRPLLRYEAQWERFLRILSWIKAHPRPGIYLRQLSLKGVDSKFIEKHKGILSQMLDRILEEGEIDPRFAGAGKFEKRYGFLSRPELVRFRILDEESRIAGLSDLTLRADEFARLAPRAERIFVVENDVTALAFPPLPRSLVLFGRGYHFEGLEGARWLRDQRIFYWGDVDTHGLAILAQFRSLFPHTVSLLMDRETLLAHRAHWGREEKPLTACPAGLTEEESALMADLLDNRHGENLRLEQEFLPFSALQKALDALDF